ncbi:MAG: hypothetical protein DNFNHJIP_00478 [Candidatus Argoarchaeum ethanivorans]|uniref:Uncharacterized protein n=1 Tax=Candidatus Argoarchaeum ethanivorans TaxID=2608793 RepID=A0A812A238_9EURY|nr:MAG: hypothetical protein DNFNHJIP_00478 [Candidatus Argoarchaeum ethanivorans]
MMGNTGVCLILSLKSFCLFSMKIYAHVSSKNLSKITNPLVSQQFSFGTH